MKNYHGLLSPFKNPGNFFIDGKTVAQFTLLRQVCAAWAEL
jgi:hypothetical protein